ncbi:hypothetical protein [Streptomyces clavuligerus]|nr:hypothetical protein [Streptomyces clavuligerus]WDN56015.1 hypothetical protein LL058_29465 [Streptomyces clavuligerus]
MKAPRPGALVRRLRHGLAAAEDDDGGVVPVHLAVVAHSAFGRGHERVREGLRVR